jgi:hypothetical protein
MQSSIVSQWRAKVMMMNTIERVTGTLGHERLYIRGFHNSSAMHEFLNKGANGVAWRPSTNGLKPGVYAFLGGQWRNVKTLDPMMMAHV